ncbi:FAD-dependent oxidoreductase [Micromonospora sp. U21]|uniref:FAD-dependent oxidoreductase n=1 Tax=Micromonospora sp. U21 TaxID=2824899 RepID=UPI001B397FBE|nr:FAD-dependent oxidoreductase [Micromonospora sp. U21]MBQ0906946.1 FAD-dependent oxidoreductase [Micromonospora sp. U21]
MSMDVDVVVVGAGGCGLTAAIAAAEASASVALLEKLDRAGGNTFVSTGSIPAAGTRYQRAAGIDDDPDRMTADLLRQSGPHDAEPLVRLLAEQSASLVEWLVEKHRVDLRIITDYRHVGHSVPRLHAPPDRRGESLMWDLLAAARRLDVEVVTGNPVTELIVEDGRVCGVRVGGHRADSYELRSSTVVLAANGFGRNAELLRRFAPDIAGGNYLGAEGSTGEALTWCLELGADTGNMGAYQGYAAVAYPHGSITSWTTVEMGGILLDPRGRRIGDESVGYSGFTGSVAARGDQGFVVFDTRVRDYVAAHEPEFVELVKMKGVLEADSPAAVARFIGADEAEVTVALRSYEEAARQGRPDDVGRSEFGMAPLTPPYCVVRAIPALFHTQGGVRVTDSAQVLRTDGTPVPGLYAGGGVTTGLSGAHGAAGYSSGNGLLSAIGLGRIAGRAAATTATTRGTTPSHA